MDTKGAIDFLDNDVLTISIIDQKVDEFYDKIQGVKNLLQQGGKYKKMWEWLKATWIRKDDDCSKIWFEIDGENLKGVINELDELVDHIEQLCSPKEESK